MIVVTTRKLAIDPDPFSFADKARTRQPGTFLVIPNSPRQAAAGTPCSEIDVPVAAGPREVVPYA